MTEEKQNLKALIVENIKESRQLAGESLVKSGWEIVYKSSGEKALEAIENSKLSPFALIISGVRMPDMEGYVFLKKAGKIAPDTQRMVIIPNEEKEVLIRAINTANINACFSYPFKEEDLIYEADNCYKIFQDTQKRRQYKRLIKHQNKQLYEAAQQFNKKFVKNKQRINDKSNRILQLKSQRRKQGKQDLTNMSLDQFVEYKKISRQPDLFLKEFEQICKCMKSFIEKTASKYSFEWKAQNLNKIISGDSEKFEPIELVENLKKLALIDSLDKHIDTSNLSKGSDPLFHENTFDQYLEFIVSDDHLIAKLLKKKKIDKEIVNLTSILDFLRENQISYGIVDDNSIEKWLDKPYVKDDQILIAEGKAALPGKEGTMTYNFTIDYTNPGKILEDGTIDFRDRGEIPFVKKGDLLASLTPSKQSIAGINLFGGEITVEEVIDPLFVADSGTLLSEDGLSITADADGQPHVDDMGNVSVNEEMIINNDVDFETGNIHFEGNIVVKGVVKHGFAVKGINLTAKAIDGADIELSGDLNVSDGITNANIKTVGNIYTKFINNCKIYGFGDFIVQKEILDSSMWLSGSCQIPTGHVIASDISAKQGIEAKNIGTDSSQAPVLRVGIDDHIDSLEKQIQTDLEESLNKRDKFKTQIKELNKKESKLHKGISDNAYIQDRSQIEIKEHENQLTEQKVLKDNKAIQEIKQSIIKLKKKADSAETALNELFNKQDIIGIAIEELNNKVQVQEEKNIAFIAEKKHLQKIREKNTPDPKISVNQTIVQGTKIKGPKSSLILSQDQSRCIIQEQQLEDGMTQYFEMTINDL